MIKLQIVYSQILTAVIWFLFSVFSALEVSASNANSSKYISFGLSGISDWSTQIPYIDIMKTARPWVGHLPNHWGSWRFSDLFEEGYINRRGWPVKIPTGVLNIETRILTDQPVSAKWLAGRYHLFFEGDGDLNVFERGRIIKKERGHWVFDYAPGEGSVVISISELNLADPIRNIQVIREDQLGNYSKGEKFNPVWLSRIKTAKSIRYMDWMKTNGSRIIDLASVPAERDFSYAWRGVPLSDLIELSNYSKIDPWFTLPHMANDEFVQEFAEYVHENLSPDRVAHVEYSNEVWNFIFEQANWARRQSELKWGAVGDGWMQFYGMRAAQVMKIWADVFGSEADKRLKRIISVHTGWPELEKSSLYGELARSELGAAPVEFFDAYAVTGYFGHELGDPSTLANALDDAAKQARRRGEDAGLSRIALREFVEKNQFNGVIPVAADIVRRGSLHELIEVLWPYHAKAARAAGLELLMYEGGTHAAPVGEAVDDERLSQFLIDFNYSEEMGDLYVTLLNAWRKTGDGPFNAFVDVAPPSKWGSWGALRHLDDHNPRWEALQDNKSMYSQEEHRP